jgi:hypothetical protein
MPPRMRSNGGLLPISQFVGFMGISMVFGKWLYFQYVLSFVFGKSLLSGLCFQYVLSFVFFRTRWARSHYTIYGTWPQKGE